MGDFGGGEEFLRPSQITVRKEHQSRGGDCSRGRQNAVLVKRMDLEGATGREERGRALRWSKSRWNLRNGRLRGKGIGEVQKDPRKRLL